MSSEAAPPPSEQPQDSVPVSNPPADANPPPSDVASASAPTAAAPTESHAPAQPRPSVTSADEKGTPDRRGTEARRISEIRDELITERDRKALEELRPKIRAEFGVEHEAEQNDFKLMRFIRARKYDIEAAYQQYSKTVHWRKKNHVDQWATFDVQNIRCLVPETFHGFDKHGWPSYIVKAGQVDPNRVRRMSVQDFIQVHIWGNEYSFQRAAEKGRELGRPVDRFSNIIDLEGLGTKHRKILHYVKAVAKIDERYYPECLGHTYIVNAPWIFGVIWSLVKSWLDPVTVSKISVLGPDYKKELLKYYDAKDLPVEYGGTCQCAGGCFKIPTDKEIDDAMDRHEAKMKLTEHKIKAGESFTQVIAVGKFGANIRFYFRTKDYDVKLSAVFTPDPAQQVPLNLHHPPAQSAAAAPGPAAPGGAAPAAAPTPLPKGAIPAAATATGAQPIPVFTLAKVESHKQPEMHVFDVYGPGKLQITWDNSYSIWKDKVLYYHVHSEDHDEAPHEIDAEEFFPLNLV